MISLTMVLLTALAAQQPRFDTDTTVAVPQGARLRLQNQSGDILVRTWGRQEMRIQAMHAARAQVEVDVRGQLVDIRVRDRMGLPRAVDYELTVPATMALDLGGMHSEISIDGIRAPVKANTLDGNITLRGGSESIQLTALSGRIDVSGARGRLEVRAVSNSVTVNDMEGELIVESVSGSIDLRNIVSRSVDAQGVSGSLVFQGRIDDRGTYTLVSHSGSVTLGLPDNTNATISASVSSGTVRSSFPMQSERQGRRLTRYRLGAGTASIDVETFSGSIRILRTSELEPPRERGRNRGGRSDRDEHDRDAGEFSGMMLGVDNGRIEP